MHGMWRLSGAMGEMHAQAESQRLQRGKARCRLIHGLPARGGIACGVCAMGAEKSVRRRVVSRCLSIERPPARGAEPIVGRGCHAAASVARGDGARLVLVLLRLLSSGNIVLVGEGAGSLRGAILVGLADVGGCHWMWLLHRMSPGSLGACLDRNTDRRAPTAILRETWGEERVGGLHEHRSVVAQFDLDVNNLGHATTPVIPIAVINDRRHHRPAHGDGQGASLPRASLGVVHGMLRGNDASEGLCTVAQLLSRVWM